ncbi:AfsR/SARP family transcriptional regulator [Micromonospora sp. WMMD1082]|uniref:AfsR/SARP family transcriptional regulator n=1 Tax=Micromonospora sp. WMMD1082 TaxID=3016104 RepID=UPI00241735D9|nr:AfsR/SARP family transcriptional regulator [Micromonospora sp. WMMD1082]MDG4798269.1 BTAD domain-containing putative transcriptional regulator [Micromonospora sp. WMMD1082]
MRSTSRPLRSDHGFRLLGSLEVHRHGRQVPIGARRHRVALGALLLEANRLVPIDRLTELIWPEQEPPRTARNAIQVSISTLRAALGDSAPIVKSGDGYQISVAPQAVDVHRFRDLVTRARDAEPARTVQLLREADGLWRGPVLAGTLADGARHRVATGLDEERAAAVEDRIDAELQLGHHHAVVGELFDLVRTYPHRERLFGLLMIALYRDGQPVRALELYQELRSRLIEEFGTDPGPELRRLETDILRQSAELLSVRPPTHPPAERARPARRTFLPPPPPDFTGRVAESTRLLARAAIPGALSVVTIDGMGGVGKTSFAVQVAHRLRETYPDGQFFVDLRGLRHGDPPLSAEAALGVLLRCAGVPDDLVPPDLAGRAAGWRSLTANRRVLLVLDDAVDEQQIQPLLPGAPGSLAVVTSRRRLVGLAGATPLSLDVLPLDQAVTMFQRATAAPGAAAAGPEVEEVVRLCGRLPLAIRIIAARLRVRPTWTMADLLRRLRTRQSRVWLLSTADGTRVVDNLATSYLALPDPLARLFRLLSLHPGDDFDPDAVAALAGLEVAVAESMLDRLVDDNLVGQRAAGRYHLHEMTRDCAVELSERYDPAVEREAARRRLFDHYRYLSTRHPPALQLSGACSRP